MKYVYSLFILFLLAYLSSCSSNITPGVSEDFKETEVIDLHSYSNYSDVFTEHLHLDFDVNFDNKTIYGIARHQISEHDCDSMIFDIKYLEIIKVTLDQDEIETSYVIGEHDSLLGQPLSVDIKDDTKFVNIYYQTTEECEAIDWLPAELTSGKKYPFLYTQGQAILSRSWIPLQDTPTQRITYTADVKVPVELMAVMSAKNSTTRDSIGCYHFEMMQPIPAYLIALAVGDLRYHKLSNNTGVYAEPELIDACASEFEDLPKMITAAEKIYGKYQWDQYDLIVMPYSFPIGGMENPRLTFVNPTLLAGDKSLVSTVAHELAHSWSGNLVTNGTWNDFWLNEGFTVYFENRIMEEVYGKEVADILAIIEFQDLTMNIDDIENGNHPEDTQLKLNLEGRSPDDGMTDIAYNKGAYFLRTLENVAGRKKFDQFLNGYFNKYQFKTITTEEFVSYLNKELLLPNQIEFNVEEWIYQPGIPDNCIEIKSERLDHMIQLAEDIQSGTIDPKNIELKRDERTTQEWITFIRNLYDGVSNEKLESIDEVLHFSSEANNAIKSEWFKLAAAKGVKSARTQMLSFLKLVGRRWFIEGIYQNLVDHGDIEFAKYAYDQSKESYHYMSRSTIEEILKG